MKMTMARTIIWVFVSLFSLLDAKEIHRRDLTQTKRSLSADLPPGWDLAPGSLAEYPTVSVAGHPVIVIDPWSYLQRLGLYKIILNSTEKYFKTWGNKNTGNLLWGLPLQFGWQYSTKRLQDREHRNTLKNFHFSPKCWWGAMNYYLSVIPFLGCLDAGVINKAPFPVHIQSPQNDTGKFCTSVNECTKKHPIMMEKWKNFFTQLQKMMNNDFAPEIIPPQHDTIIGYLWGGHTASVSVASPLFKEELTYMPKPEQMFSADWANIVLVIADVHFQTNFNQTLEQQRLLLPPRVLKPGDVPPFIPDFSKPQNKALLVMHLIRKANEESSGLVLRLWHKAMCSPQGRADGWDLMMNVILHPEIIPKDLVKILLDFIKDHKC